MKSSSSTTYTDTNICCHTITGVQAVTQKVCYCFVGMKLFSTPQTGILTRSDKNTFVYKQKDCPKLHYFKRNADVHSSCELKAFATITGQGLNISTSESRLSADWLSMSPNILRIQPASLEAQE